MTDEELKKLTRNFLASLTRRKRFIPAPTAFKCLGGPFDQAQVFLQNNATLDLVVGAWRGRYHQMDGQGDYYNVNCGNTVVWEGSSGEPSPVV